MTLFRAKIYGLSKFGPFFDYVKLQSQNCNFCIVYTFCFDTLTYVKKAIIQKIVKTLGIPKICLHDRSLDHLAARGQQNRKYF